MRDQPAGRGTILLVEDEPFVALLVQQVLEDHGFAVVVATHGRAALEQVERSRPGATWAGSAPLEGSLAAAPDALVLALVDMGLPDMDGGDVVRALRRLLPALPIVIATGYATEEIEAEFARVDGVAVIRKPYDGSTLRTTFQRFGIDLPEE
ncbi:response regulator [Xanthobacter agilis]|uniref:CheY-like chemotaxis protein n=1 Tax=Xanthobacter agilis TaxID=47492 RepID=A0ABU0L8J7_XANAG|nr:response regulator [Xanthobacter agilis]MDQ0503458.1 CheY-like chemotaxis protein [Xanthobacter agilis]